MINTFYRDYKFITYLYDNLIASIHSDGYLTINNYITNDNILNIKCHCTEITAFHKIDNILLLIGTVEGLIKVFNRQ